MKTKQLTQTVLLISMAAITPAVLAQSKPGTGYPVTGTQTGGTATDRNDIDSTTTGGTTTDRTNTTGSATPGRTTATGAEAKSQAGSLTMIIADGSTYSTLTKALKATGLDDTLGGSDQYTIFAPTDEAFDKLPSETLSKLMLPENKDKLRTLLLNHVVAGRMTAADLKDGDVKTLNGEKIKIDVAADKIQVDGEKVDSSEISASNGVVHGIGKVLVPKSLNGFAGLKD